MAEAVIKWSYDPAAVPAELAALLESLSEIFALEVNSDNPRKLIFEKIEAAETVSEVEFTAPDRAVIRYNSVSAAARGVGSALAGISGRQTTPFTMLGIMIDLSRNIVFTVDAMTRLFRRLALLGYNTVFLYCEDTYVLPGEPAFGVMRGRYTADEIRAMDDAANAVGVELIGCIQTLGHLAQILRWTTAYGKIKDTVNEIRVDVPETHALIGKMLDFWSANLRSRRIHVGMDETHDLGRGKYLDQKGYTPQFDLFVMHLNAVTKACVERGLKPMIWSDMFFRLGNPQRDYYAKASDIPSEVRAAIPKEVELVYWDYYNVDQQFYEDFIEQHRELAGEPLMGAGVWIWSRLWYDHMHGSIANRACINGCRKRKLKEIFFTMWGDDGAVCHFDSAWTGLTEAADLSYGTDDEELFSLRYKVLTGSDYHINQLPGLMHRCTKQSGSQFDVVKGHNTDLAILWDDLLMGLGYRNLLVMDKSLPGKLLATFEEILEKITPYRNDIGGGDLNYGWHITRYLRDKLACRIELVRAYKDKDKAALKLLAEKVIPELVTLLEEVMRLFRKQWLANAKPFGLETMQHRFGGERERLLEASRSINDYLDGTRKALDELDEPLLAAPERMAIYQDMASGSTWR